MRTTNKQYILAGLLIVSSYLLTACGAKNSTSSGTSSLSSVAPSASSSSGNALAQCNRGSSNLGALKLKSNKDASGNTAYEFVNAKFESIESSFQNSGYQIEFFRWMADASGSVFLDSTPLKFKIVDNSGNNLSNYMTQVTWIQLKNIASSKSVSVSNAGDFFNNFQIVIDTADTTGSYSAIKSVLYDSNLKTVDQIDMLLPPFKANPSAYQTTSTGATRASVLQSLHPFNQYLSSGYADSDFVSMANAYCF